MIEHDPNITRQELLIAFIMAAAGMIIGIIIGNVTYRCGL